MKSGRLSANLLGRAGGGGLLGLRVTVIGGDNAPWRVRNGKDGRRWSLGDGDVLRAWRRGWCQ